MKNLKKVLALVLVLASLLGLNLRKRIPGLKTA